MTVKTITSFIFNLPEDAEELKRFEANSEDYEMRRYEDAKKVTYTGTSSFKYTFEGGKHDS